MARICRRCGRKLTEEEHDLARYTEGKRKGEPIRRIVTRSRGRGRFGINKERVWSCRVRLSAISPTSGRRLVPSSPQREAVLGMPAYVHVDRLREEH